MKHMGVGIGFVAMFLAMVTLLVWLQGSAASTHDKKALTHMHCPDCGLEIRYQGDLEGKPCPQCGTAGAKLLATAGPGKGRSHEVGLTGKILVAAVVSFVVVQGLGYVWVLRGRARRRAEEESKKRPLVCQCPFCARKLGYPAHKVGAGTLCPRCKTAFTLPEGEVLDDA